MLNKVLFLFLIFAVNFICMGYVFLMFLRTSSAITFETFVEFVIFFLFLQQQLLQIHLSPANLTTAIHYTLASHKQISTNFNAFKTHWHVSLQTLQNINTSHQYSKNYTGSQSNKQLITNSVSVFNTPKTTRLSIKHRIDNTNSCLHTEHL